MCSNFGVVHLKRVCINAIVLYMITFIKYWDIFIRFLFFWFNWMKIDEQNTEKTQFALWIFLKNYSKHRNPSIIDEFFSRFPAESIRIRKYAFVHTKWFACLQTQIIKCWNCIRTGPFTCKYYFWYISWLIIHWKLLTLFMKLFFQSLMILFNFSWY